jgi:hypothetical protein
MATSRTRLRARDHYTSSTLIGGNGGASPSSCFTLRFWGTNGVCDCKTDVKSIWILTWHQMDHVAWSLGLRVSHTRLRARDHYISSTLIDGSEKVEPVQVCFTLRLGDQWSMWMQDGSIVYMDPYMASIGSCFIVTWTIFKNHLLEVGLTQNRETMALRTLTTVDLF